MAFDPEEGARAGVFVSLDSSGSVQIERGFVRPEDDPPVADEGADRDEATGGHGSVGEPSEGSTETGGSDRAGEDDEDEGDAAKPLPERLVIELTAHRTLALRDAVANNPRVAMTALLHKLARDCFGIRAQGAALEAGVREVYLAAQSPDLGDSYLAQSIDARHVAWRGDIPLDAEDDALWTWLDDLDGASRQSLLAHCVSFGVNALFERPNPYSGMGLSQQGLERRLREADRLARATGLDMVEAGWKPTVANYLGRVTKARILEAVREGVGEGAAQMIDHLKKAEMAAEAERLLDGKGWLPEPLRLDLPQAGQRADGTLGGDTPEFLIEDDEGPAEDPNDHPERIAAE
jgi:ParB family chromosome partitioning protein